MSTEVRKVVVNMVLKLSGTVDDNSPPLYDNNTLEQNMRGAIIEDFTWQDEGISSEVVHVTVHAEDWIEH